MFLLYSLVAFKMLKTRRFHKAGKYFIVYEGDSKFPFVYS